MSKFREALSGILGEMPRPVDRLIMGHQFAGIALGLTSNKHAQWEAQHALELAAMVQSRDRGPDNWIMNAVDNRNRTGKKTRGIDG